MSSIENALNQVIAAILDSEEYREYDLQRHRVNRYPELKAQIDEFRTRNFEMQLNMDNAFEKIEAFEKEYEDFRENPLVSDFLAAELAFCRMMQSINIRITEAVQFE